MVIYRHSTVITKVMLLYNTEWQYDHGMAVHYRRKKFITLGPEKAWSRSVTSFIMLVPCLIPYTYCRPTGLLAKEGYSDILSLTDICQTPTLVSANLVLVGQHKFRPKQAVAHIDIGQKPPHPTHLVPQVLKPGVYLDLLEQMFMLA